MNPNPASPDDATFRHVARVYAANHPQMSDPATPGCDNPKKVGVVVVGEHDCLICLL